MGIAVVTLRELLGRVPAGVVLRVVFVEGHILFRSIL